MVTSDTVLTTSDKILRKSIYEAHKGVCFYSNINLDFNDFDIDHIVPSKLDGKSNIENFVLSSPRINRKKNSSYDEQIMQKFVLINKLVFVNKVVDLYNKYSENICIENKKSDIEKIGYYNLLIQIIKNRRESGMTQAQFADWINVERRKIIDFEKGKRIDLEMLCAICEKLSIEIELNFKQY